MNQHAPANRKNIDIEVLRAIAIVFTLVVHFTFLIPYSSVSLQWVFRYFDLSIGVDLFFVISGFVITQSLIFATRNPSSAGGLIRAFWIKRVFRLLPAAQLWLLVAAIFYFFANTLSENFQPLVAAFFNAANLYWAYCAANPQDQMICSEMGNLASHYWSLSLEEQFYLVFPLLFFFVKRRVLVLLLIVWIGLQFFWQRPFWSLGWFVRLDAISWGVLLGLVCGQHFYQQMGSRLAAYRGAAFLVFLGLCLLLPFVANQVLGFGTYAKAYGVGVVALIGAVLVWMASYDQNLFTRAGAARRVLAYLGARSYALYLSHVVVFKILLFVYQHHIETEQLASMPVLVNACMLVMGLVLTVASSELTYRLVEVRFRRVGRAIAASIVDRGATSSAEIDIAGAALQRQ